MPPLTDLETRLAGPDGALARRQVLQSLGAIEWRLRQGLANGVTREQYQRLHAWTEAVQAAQRVLDGPSPGKGEMPTR